MRGVTLFFFAFILSASGTNAQNTATLDTVSIELKWFHQFQFAGYYAADIKGFYEAEGLYVNIIEGSLKLDYIKDIVSGKTDFGIYHSGLLIDYARGADVVALNAIFQYSPGVLAAKADRNYQHLSDLADATIMVGEEIGAEIIKSIFLQQGINIDSLKLIQFNFERFKTDSTVDAINTYVTSEVPLLESEGIPLDVFYPWHYGIDFYGDVLFTSGKFLKNNRSIVERFQRATLRGWEYTRQNEDEIIEYIQTLDGVAERGFDYDRLKTEAKLTWEYTIPDKIPIGYMSETRWKTIASFLVNSGAIESVPDISKFIIQPATSISSRLLRYLNIIVPILILLSVMVFGWIYTLRKEVRSKTDEAKKVYEERVLVEKESKAELLAAFKEKEVILAEVHHRVKNNMALITSLIELQRQEIDNPDADTILKEAQLRIHTIADIHEKLYDHESFTQIPFKAYVNHQIDNILSYVNKSSPEIIVERAIEDLSLNINYSIPVALIINECVTNCLYHAFDARSSGKISVTFCNAGNKQFQLTVEDNGTGFDADPNTYTSVGLTIIRALADQIEADLEITSSKSGTKISAKFNTDS